MATLAVAPAGPRARRSRCCRRCCDATEAADTALDTSFGPTQQFAKRLPAGRQAARPDDRRGAAVARPGQRAVLAAGARRPADRPDAGGPEHRRHDRRHDDSSSRRPTRSPVLHPQPDPDRQRVDPGSARHDRAAGLPGAVPERRRARRRVGELRRQRPLRARPRPAAATIQVQTPSSRTSGRCSATWCCRRSARARPSPARRRRSTATWPASRTPRRTSTRSTTGGGAVKRAIMIHRTDFIAIIVARRGRDRGRGLHPRAPALVHASSRATTRSRPSSRRGAAVTAGQGQTVDIAGVQVGQVGGVKLENGRAVVTMNIFKKYAPIYQDATVLLRPRTPLKDMYLALDPGTPDRRGGPERRHARASAHAAPTSTSTRSCPRSTPTRATTCCCCCPAARRRSRTPGNTGAAPSPQRGRDLRGVFKRFAPLNRDTQTFTRLLAAAPARTSGARSTTSQVVTKSLGSVNGQLTSLIKSSNTNFPAISSQDANLEQALTLLPGTLQQTIDDARQGARRSRTRARPRCTRCSRSPTRSGRRSQAARPLFSDTTPVIQNQLRPFAVAVQPVAKVLAPASAELAKATPPSGHARSAC